MGAVVCVRWSPDGSALCSCGEDGDVKVRLLMDREPHQHRAGTLLCCVLDVDARLVLSGSHQSAMYREREGRG